MKTLTNRATQNQLAKLLLCLVCITVAAPQITGLAIVAALPAEQQSHDAPGEERDPALQRILDVAGLYAKHYQELCRELVAEERMVQKEYDKKGVLRNQRSFVSDYLMVTLPSDPERALEFRDILSIDGHPLRRRRKLVEVLKEKSSNAFKEAERVASESTKHNLGRQRYSNMVNFGLSFILPDAQPSIEYEFEQAGGPAANSEWVLIRFREKTDDTKLHANTPMGRKPIPSQGLIWLSQGEFKVLRIDFQFKQEADLYAIAGRYVSEYSPALDGLLLPSRFEERFFDVKNPERLLFESVATYANFRKFSVDVKISPGEP